MSFRLSITANQALQLLLWHTRTLDQVAAHSNGSYHTYIVMSGAALLRWDSAAVSHTAAESNNHDLATIVMSNSDGVVHSLMMVEREMRVDTAFMGNQAAAPQCALERHKDCEDP